MNYHSFNSYEKELESVEMHLSELIDLCIERIKLYMLMEGAGWKKHKLGSREWCAFMKNGVITQKLKTYDILLRYKEGIGVNRAREKDHLAHRLLSLCYCKTDELKYNFIKWEIQWFILVYKQMTKDEIHQFFKNNNFIYDLVSPNERNLIENVLNQCSDCDRNLDWYKAPFHTISTYLISCRKIFLHKGMAYFPENYIIYCVRDAIMKQFTKQLAWNSRILPICMDDEQIRHLLEATSVFIPSNYKSESLDVNLDNIDEIAKNHYPLCMQNLHNLLRKEHHLKYDSKMQYGIFLKWLGLSYEDAMVFWEEEFTKKMTNDWFKRKYSYLFKHQYGRVGSRMRYSSYSCDKIQDYNPVANQHHGCPFKHWNREILLGKLQDEALISRDVRNIMDCVGQKEYKEACTLYFIAKHEVVKEDIIQSPNQYAAESYKAENDLNKLMESICNGLD